MTTSADQPGNVIPFPRRPAWAPEKAPEKHLGESEAVVMISAIYVTIFILVPLSLFWSLSQLSIH
ncbi:MAG: hypothetical protein AAF543_20080 [Pseudomonadota bacterium]